MHIYYLTFYPYCGELTGMRKLCENTEFSILLLNCIWQISFPPFCRTLNCEHWTTIKHFTIILLRTLLPRGIGTGDKFDWKYFSKCILDQKNINNDFSINLFYRGRTLDIIHSLLIISNQIKNIINCI